MSEAIESGVGKTTEAVVSVEPKTNHEKIQKTVTDTADILRSFNDATLSPDQLHTKESYLTVLGTLNPDTLTKEVHIEDTDTGTKFDQIESVGVDGVIALLREKSKLLSDEEKKQYRDLANTLRRYSKSYGDLPHRLEPSHWSALVKTEALLISKDSRATGDPVSDYYKAIDTLRERRELVMPRKTALRSADAASSIPAATTTTNIEAPTSAETEATDSHEPTPITEIAHNIAIYSLEPRYRQLALIAAEKTIDKEKSRGKRFDPRRIFRGMKYNMGDEYYRQKFADRAVSLMRENRNGYLEMDLVKNALADSKDTISSRVRWQKDVTASIERVKTLADATNEGVFTSDTDANGVETVLAGQSIKEVTGELREKMLAEIIKPAASGAFTSPKALNERLVKFVNDNKTQFPELDTLFGATSNRYGLNVTEFGTDLFEMGEKAKADIAAHKYSLDQLDKVTRINLGNINLGADTEGKFTKVDQLMAKLRKNQVGGVIAHPLVAAAAFSVGVYAATRAARMGAKLLSPISVGISGALVGGGLAAWKRNYDLKIDMASHNAQMAEGWEMDSNKDKQHKVLEQAKFQYDHVTVGSLLGGEGKDNNGLDRKGIQALLTLDISDGQQSNRQAVIGRIAEITARLEFSTENKIDLIRYSNGTEGGRLELIKALVELKQAAKKANIDTLNEDITRNVGKWKARFIENKEQQDKEFKKHRWVQSAKAGTISSAAGFGLGFIIQHAEVKGLREYNEHFRKDHDVRHSAAEQSASGFKHLVNDKNGSAKDRLGEGIDNRRADSRINGAQALLEGKDMKISDTLTAHPSADHTHVTLTDSATAKSVTLDMSADGKLSYNGTAPLDTTFTSQLDKLFAENTTSGDLLMTGKIVDIPGSTYQIVPHSDQGIVSIIDKAHGGTNVKDFRITNGQLEPTDGHLSTELQAELNKYGFQVHSHTEPITQQLPATHIDGADTSITHFTTTIPEGSHWVALPNDPDHFNLVMDNDPKHVLVGNAWFDQKTGELNYDPKLSDANIIPVKPEQPLDNGIRVEQVAAKEYLANKETKVDGFEFRNNNTPRIYDFNELGGSTIKNGSQMLMDMRRMTPSGSFNDLLHPRAVDVPQALKDHQVSALFEFPDGRHFVVQQNIDTGILLDTKDNDPSHVLHLFNDQTHKFDKTVQIGEFSRAFINEKSFDSLPDGYVETELYNHQDMWNVGQDGKAGVISYGMMRVENGKSLWDSFAAIHGKGEMGPIEKTVNRTPNWGYKIGGTLDSTKETYTVTPPSFVHTEFAPPITEVGEAPIIPLPITFNYPLEPLTAIDVPPTVIDLPPTPPSEYYSGINLESAQAWLRLHPASHKPYRKVKNKDGTTSWIDTEGKPVRRDTRRERETIELFINSLETADPAHFAEVQRYVKELPAMKESVRVAVNIPAWMEAGNIYNVLHEYTQQEDKEGNTLNPDLYEINIIVNRKTGETPDNTVAEIERFKRDALSSGKQFNINYIDVEFPEGYNNVGNARKLITNLTLLRSINRKKQDNPLYIESEDADLIHVDRNTVANLIQAFDTNPHLDAVRGMQDRTPEILMKNDFLFLYRRMQDFKELLIRRQGYRYANNLHSNFAWNRVITGGWNTGYTAEAYALIGGYVNQSKGEDMMMGELMSMVRGDGITPNTDVIGKVATRSDSSPRRYIYEVATGQAAYGDSFENPAVNAEIRNKSNDELMNYISNLARMKPENKDTLQEMVNNEYGFIKSTTPNGKEAEKVLRLAMLYLGFKREDYELTSSGEVKLIEVNNVAKAVEDYRGRHATAKASGRRTGHRS